MSALRLLPAVARLLPSCSRGPASPLADRAGYVPRAPLGYQLALWFRRCAVPPPSRAANDATGVRVVQPRGASCQRREVTP